MKIGVPVRLMPTPEVASALEATLHACNDAANWLSGKARERGITSRKALQRFAYHDLKARGLSAQPALHVPRKVADAYSALTANIRNGNLGKPGSKRRRKAESKPIAFRTNAAQPYDDRCLSRQVDRRIRQRARLRKPQRVTLHSWTFAQLGQFLEYKARRAGVPLVFVDPAYTSQTCSQCQHIDRRNRVDQRTFICRGCGVVAHADRNASHNIAQRGETVWRTRGVSHASRPPHNGVSGCRSRLSRLLGTTSNPGPQDSGEVDCR